MPNPYCEASHPSPPLIRRHLRRPKRPAMAAKFEADKRAKVRGRYMLCGGESCWGEICHRIWRFPEMGEPQ